MKTSPIPIRVDDRDTFSRDPRGGIFYSNCFPAYLTHPIPSNLMGELSCQEQCPALRALIANMRQLLSSSALSGVEGDIPCPIFFDHECHFLVMQKENS
jgi:hypothetical protein